jgi:formylglycine-generating enzyme required for sulfatase activity
MAGNVWEWTTDWWSRHAEDPAGSCCVPTERPRPTMESSYDPAQPQFRVPRRVIKGGSFLCADSYCQRYRPAARRPQTIDTGMSHIGFRCIRRP